MNNRISAVKSPLCYLSHLPVLFVPGVCYLSRSPVLFVPLDVLIVPLLVYNIRNISIRKIKPVKKSLSNPAAFGGQGETSPSQVTPRTLPGIGCMEVLP